VEVTAVGELLNKPQEAGEVAEAAADLYIPKAVAQDIQDKGTKVAQEYGKVKVVAVAVARLSVPSCMNLA
jgi:hypothetical protein